MLSDFLYLMEIEFRVGMFNASLNIKHRKQPRKLLNIQIFCI